MCSLQRFQDCGLFSDLLLDREAGKGKEAGEICPTAPSTEGNILTKVTFTVGTAR